jgi:hypothetical protein
MHDVTIGPFAITFTPDGVEFSTAHPDTATKLSYTECYELFRALYVRRDTIYKYTHRENLTEPQQIDGKATYTENQGSFAVASWETEIEPDKE